MKTILPSLVLSLAVLAATCPHAVAAEDCAPPARRMARTELMFGLGSGRTQVSQRQWQRFVAREIAPRFPEGFRLFDAQGQWRNKAGVIVRESSRQLLVWHAEGAETDLGIEAIRAAYKARFHQESVLRADGFSCVSF